MILAPSKNCHFRKETQTERYRARALDKGLDILEVMVHESHGLTRADIVKATGRDLSEMSRMIEKLVDREYAGRSTMGDQCARTMKLFQLGAVCPLLYLW